MTLPEARPSFGRRICYLLISDLAAGTTARVLLGGVIFAALLAADRLDWPPLRIAAAASVVAGYTAMLVWSPTVRNILQADNVVGFWRYDNLPESEVPGSEHDQAPETVRLVQVDRDRNGLRFRGWLMTEPGTLFFTSEETIVTNFGAKSGRLFYWYKSPEDAPKERSFFGHVILEWHKDHPAACLQRMTGRYYGRTSGSMGRVSYRRISAADFERLRHSATAPLPR